MVDEFNSENGATRFAPGLHRLSSALGNPMDDEPLSFEEEVFALSSAGSMIIFNGSVFHGHSANNSPRRRRSIQGAFIPREARAAINQAARIRRDTFERIGPLARYVLDVD
jgi:ectoine hydroxylase-related dioxygenase (phytanoyl-CoA dioxygenase family)